MRNFIPIAIGQWWVTRNLQRVVKIFGIQSGKTFPLLTRMYAMGDYTGVYGTYKPDGYYYDYGSCAHDLTAYLGEDLTIDEAFGILHKLRYYDVPPNNN